MTWNTWKRHFGNVAPIGHVLRSVVPERWLRIHSLPQSKRYPTEASEEIELLRRHNEAATDVLGAGSNALLFVHFHVNREEFARELSKFDWSTDLGCPCTDLRAFVVDDSDDDYVQPVVSCNEIEWIPGGWNKLLLDVAHWRIASVVLMNPGTGEVYAPYEGGADFFFRSPERVTEKAVQWQPWLSSHDAGL
jgi:hypothetical protein